MTRHTMTYPLSVVRSGYRVDGIGCPFMIERLEAEARLYDAAAEQLERAAAHCRTAAGHFRSREIPRGAAHAWAAVGHIRLAEGSLEEQAKRHAGESSP